MNFSKIFTSLKNNEQLGGFLQGMGSSQGGVLSSLLGGVAGAATKKKPDEMIEMIPDPASKKRKRAISGALGGMFGDNGSTDF